MVRSEIPGISNASREVRAEVLPLPWPPASAMAASAQTPVAPSASPPRFAASSAIILDPIFVRGKGEPNLQSATKSSRKRRLRLGLPKTFFSDVISPDVEFTFEQALRLLQKSGSNLKEVSIPLLFETQDAGNQIAWAEATHY